MADLTDVYKPNELIGAFSQLELNRLARHLFNYFLRHAQHEIKLNNYQGNTFEISTVELNELAQLDRHDYKIIKKSLMNLMQPIILRDDPKHFKATVPLSDIDIDVEKGVYRFELNNTMLQLLRNVDYFTKLNLQELNPLRSKHSLIIFEYLKRYEHAPKIPLLSVEDLRKMTDTLNSRSYDNFNNLKINVIDVAVNEINKEDKTNYIVKYELQTERTKRRPKVSAIQFYFSKKETENNQEVIEVQVTDNNSVATPKIQDTSKPKDVKNMSANELYSVFANCFNDLSWADFCGATYYYDNYTLVAFATWARTQTHKYNKELFCKYLKDRVESPKYPNYRCRARQLSDTNIRKYLFDLNPNKQIADSGFQAFCENYYYKYTFDQLSLFLSNSLNINAVGAYDFFKKAYDEEKHHFQN